MKSYLKKSLTWGVTLCLFCCFLFAFAGCGQTSQTSWLSGTDVPEAGWGVDGDMYLDTDDGDLYHKSQGSWQKIANIKGADGERGANGLKGEVGVGVNNARLEGGRLILEFSDGTEVDAGVVKENAECEISVEDGVLKVTSKKVYETLDSEAYGGKTFRQIFLENNMIQKGNMLNNDDISAESGWTVPSNAEAPSVDTETYATAPSSLNISNTKSTHITQLLGNEYKGTLFLASQVKITQYSNGFAGLFVSYGGTNQKQGMKSKVTDGFETAAQIIENGDKSCRLYMGSGSSASMTAYVDSGVVLNLSNLFETDLPDLNTMTELYEVFLRLYQGEKNIVITDTFSSDSTGQNGEEIERAEAVRAFYDKMALKAQRLGVEIEASDINSAIGLSQKCITVQDLVRIAIHATGYDELAKIWNTPSFTGHCQGEEKTFTVDSTVVSGVYSHYLTDHYYVLGGKTGSLSANSSRPAVANLLTVVEGPDGAVFVGMVSNDKVDTEEDNRFTRAKILFDIASAKYENPQADTSDLEAQLTADRACVVVLPPHGNILSYSSYDWFGENSAYHLYSKNGTEKIYTASVWKILTAITALDYISDLDDKLTILASDISSSTPQFSGGEIITFRDALHYIMLPSSNTCCAAVARTLGEKIIRLGL